MSVAVGRFVEALFWAILRVAGMVGGVVLLALIGLGLLWWLVRRRR
nr:MYXO-CTERM sorting domain-containing protein [Sphingomonas paucimobilis]